MAPSMAAAIAASLPTVQAAPVPAAPTYEAIPPSMSKIIDIEAEIPIESVQLDALVVQKIIKHSSESSSPIALGLLIGIDLDGVLEVSNSFPLPQLSEEEEKSSKALARYQASMLRSLKEVQADDSVIGFYQANTLGAFFKQTLVDLQAVHQEKLRHGGIVVVHDITQASQGNASFHALRLTKNFLAAYRSGKFNSQSLVQHHLTFSSILEEVPLTVRTNPLLSSFLDTVTKPEPLTSSVPSATSAAIPPSFSFLDLAPHNLTQNVHHVLDALDDYKTEEGNLAYLQRQIARERAKAEQYVAKRKEENAIRVSQGLAPLPEDDVSRLFKTPADPSRLESLLLLGQIDGYAKSLALSSSTGLSKMYAADACNGI